MTKEEAKQNIATFIEKVESLQEDLWDLEDEALFSHLAVKPYDGRGLLTIEQDEIKDWFWKLRLTAVEAGHTLIAIKNYFALLDYKETQEGQTHD